MRKGEIYMYKKDLLTYLESVPEDAVVSIDSVDGHDACSVQLFQNYMGETVVRITDDPNWLYDNGVDFVQGDIQTFGIQADKEYVDGFLEDKNS